MTRRYNPRLITSRHSYTPEEIATLFRINKKTIFRWLGDGLHPLEKNTRPLLKCRVPTRATLGTEETVPTGKTIGKNARKQFFQQGKCERCGTKVNRLV